MTAETRRPAIVDTELADLWEARFDLDRTLGWKLDELHRAIGERRGRDPRTWRDLPWPTTTEEAVATARALAATAPERYPSTGYDPVVWTAIAARDALGKVEEALAAVRANERAQRPLIAEYEEARWSRFFLVTNANGHIHRDMSCSTCRPDTRYAWLPQLSGLTEADAVADQGTRLCSVCFPSAPVEWTVGVVKVDPDRCPGSGQPVRGVERQYEQRLRDRRTGEVRTVIGTVMDLFCPVCGREVPETRTGDARAHKAPKARKGSSR